MRHPEDISLVELSRDLPKRAARAILGALSPSSRGLREELRSLLDREAGTPGSFLSSPVLETMFEWQHADETLDSLAGGLLAADLVSAMDSPPEELAEHRFGRDWHPYVHQIASWKTLREIPPRSLAVTSGTGSGKTECFLVPILDDFARESAEKGPLVGVRALFLYPLNALINSQRDRLRAWTRQLNGRVRFCLYNGGTPEYPPKHQKDEPAEILSRKLLRSNPPPLLVTNPTMLEYVLARSADQPIIRSSHGLLRWIVLDEAHTYVGSRAAELSLLIRRTLHAFGVTSSQVRFVATSATIGSGEAEQELRTFVANLSGVDPTRVDVIRGNRDVPPLPGVATEGGLPALGALRAAEDPERFEILSRSSAMRRVRADLATGGAQSLHEVHKSLGAPAKDVSPSQILEILELATRSRSGGAPFLPLRMHLFHRSHAGIWACVSRSCPGCHGGPHAADWPFGRVHLARRERCESCESLVFEVVLCGSCGHGYLAAEEVRIDGDHPRAEIRARSIGTYSSDDEIAPLVELAEPAEDEAEEEDVAEGALETASEESTSDGKPRLIAGPSGIPDTTDYVMDPRSGRIVPDGSSTVSVAIDDIQVRCVRCGERSEQKGSTWRRIGPTRRGAGFHLGAAIPLFLEHLPPEMNARPMEGKRLLTFSDSRQGSARFALRTQLEAERSFLRSWVYHKVHSAGADARLAELRKTLAALEAVVEQNPGLEALLAQTRAELQALERGTPVTWAEAATALGQSTVAEWIWEQWSPDVREDIPRDDVAQFLLVREFARRPRSANSLETMGLIRLEYPSLDAVTDIPAYWKQQGLSPDEWRDFLKLTVDFVVRSASAASIPQTFLRWLGAPIRTRDLVEPDAEPLPTTSRWPLHRPKLRAPRLALVLYRALGLSSDDTTARQEVNSLLRAAWATVRETLLTLGDQGYRLDFARAIGRLPMVRFAPIREAWMCPVTRRILDTTLRGLTPYGDYRSPHARVTCERITVPKLPHGFNDVAGKPIRGANRTWVEGDPEIATLRELGVWTDFSDRIAEFAEYFRADEHSAQQAGSRLRALEAKFRDGRVNVLSSSTTMEMGVDIGGLRGVAMNNAPPGPANFLQRAGRAGRRGESTAASLTLCQASPHGEAVFTNPLWPFRSRLPVSRVSLESRPIVQRHVNAYVLAWFLKESKVPNQVTTKAGWFFEPSEGDHAAPADVLREALRQAQPLEQPRFGDGMAMLVRGTVFDGASPVSLLDQTEQELGRVAERWRGDLQGLLSAERELIEHGSVSEDEPARRAIALQLWRVRGEFLLKDLTARRFLPGHGFPTGIVPFVTTSLKEVNRMKKARAEAPADDVSDEASPETWRSFPSRDLPKAIREYRPGAGFVRDRRVYRSSGVTLNWQLPPTVEKANEIQDLRYAWRCGKCGGTGDCRTIPVSCRQCADESYLVRHRFLRPSGFAVRFTDEPHNDVTRATTAPFHHPWVSCGMAAWMPLGTPQTGRYRYSTEGHIYHWDAGSGSGYAICLQCGRAEPERWRDGPLPSTMEDHERLRGGPGKSAKGRCIGNENDWSVVRNLRLGAPLETDVFELQIGDVDRDTAETRALSIAVALRQALATHLGVDVREMGATAVPARWRDDSPGWSVVIHDVTPGGAGYAVQAPQALSKILRDAKAILECPRKCDAACHACLLAFDTESRADRLDRHEALRALSDQVLNSLDLPTGLRVFGPETRLELIPLEAALFAAMNRPDATEIRIWLGGPGTDWELAAWSLLQKLPEWARGGRKVRLLADEEILRAVPSEVRGLLASVVEVSGADLRQVAPSEMKTPGPIVEVHGAGWSSLWALPSDPLPPPRDPWLPEEAPIVRADRTGAVAESPGKTVSANDLRPKARVGFHEARMAAGDVKGRVDSFGARFWDVVFAKVPDLRVRLEKEPALAKISYEERYLRSPLSLRLLFEVLRHLASFSGGIGAKTSVTVWAQGLGRPRGYSNPYAGHHDWAAEGTRKVVVNEALGKISPAASFTIRTDVPHHRELSLAWPDGTKILVRPDQGFGFVHASQFSFDFEASPEAQAKALLAAEFPIRLHGYPTLIHVGPV